jgi:class 3 adenylate cyclase
MASRALLLTFADPDAEAGFEADRARAILPLIRIGVLAGVLLWPVIALLIPLIGPANVANVFGIAAAMVALNVVQLVLFRGRPSMRRIETIGAITCVVNGIAVIALTLAGGLPELSLYAVPGLMLVASYTFVVYQLPWRPGLVAATVVVAAYAVSPIPHVSTARAVLDLVLVISVMGFGALASYLLERSARERYLQARVIESQAAEIATEKAKSDRLLLNVLPAHIAEKLREQPEALAEQFEAATVLFADIVGFTPLSERLGPQRTAGVLNDLVSRFDALAAEHGLEKIKTIGDAYLVVGGIPEAIPDHAVRVVRMGLAMSEFVRGYSEASALPVALRIGVHSGPLVAGVIGQTKFAYDVWGDTVNVAARLETAGVPGEVQASEATVALLGDGFAIVPRGAIELKGKGAVPAFLVRAGAGAAAGQSVD